MLEWDDYEFRIAEHFLSALINGDYSGMDDAEQKQFNAWQNDAYTNIREGFTVGHWSDVEDSGEDWGRCDITGLFAMRCTVRLHIYRKIPDYGYLQHGTAPGPFRTERVAIKPAEWPRTGQWLAQFEGRWRLVHVQVCRLYIVCNRKRITIQIDGV